MVVLNKHRIFGMGYTDQIKSQFGIQNSFEIPILPELSQLSDEGAPAVLGIIFYIIIKS